ncbi:MAG: hypothetical protein ABI623_11220, partial [bacterium]
QAGREHRLSTGKVSQTIPGTTVEHTTIIVGTRLAGPVAEVKKNQAGLRYHGYPAFGSAIRF